MKLLMAGALALVSTAVLAQGVSPETIRTCGEKAWLFSMAAQFRDSRMSPQAALKAVQQNRPVNFDLNDGYVKRSINAVYFDDRFAGLDSSTLYRVVSEACVNPEPQYQPLQ